MAFTKDYLRGYSDGYNCRPRESDQSAEYDEGWNGGDGDSPTLEELTYDAGMEATDPFGY